MKNEEIGKRIKELRKQKNLSHEKLAKEIGYSKAVIGFWESGKQIPNALAIIALAKYFQISTDYILGLESDDGVKNFPDVPIIEQTQKQDTNTSICLSKEEIELLQKLTGKLKESPCIEEFSYTDGTHSINHKKKN